MDKKGMGWSTVIAMVLFIVVAVILVPLFFGRQGLFGSNIEEETESNTCRLSVIAEGSKLASFKTGDLPRLKCEKVSVEIVGNNKEDIMKELFGLMVKTSDTFCGKKVFTKAQVRYCRRRYHPITFKEKGLTIPKKEFDKYIGDNIPKNIGCLPFLDSISIDTSNEYSILFVADYSASWMQWVQKALPSLLEARLEAENEGVVLIETNKIIETKCYLV